MRSRASVSVELSHALANQTGVMTTVWAPSLAADFPVAFNDGSSLAPSFTLRMVILGTMRSLQSGQSESSCPEIAKTVLVLRGIKKRILFHAGDGMLVVDEHPTFCYDPSVFWVMPK